MILLGDAACELRVRPRPVVHRHQLPTGRVATLEHEAIPQALQVQAHELRRQRLAGVVDHRGVASAVIHSSFQVSADPRAAAKARVSLPPLREMSTVVHTLLRVRRGSHLPVRAAKVDRFHGPAVVVTHRCDCVLRVAAAMQQSACTPSCERDAYSLVKAALVVVVRTYSTHARSRREEQPNEHRATTDSAAYRS
jgi:hypothetical protein